MKLPAAKRERTLLVGVVVFGGLILYLYWTALVAPLWTQFIQLGQDARTVRVKLQETERVVAQEPQLRQEQQRLAEAIEESGRSLPSEEALPKVIETLSNVATEAGVRIQTIFPQRSFESASDPAKKDPAKGAADHLKELYKEIPIQIDALSGFHQLGVFLSRVESDAQAMEVKSLRISGNPKEPRAHDVKLVLRVYFSGSQAKHAAP